MSTTLAELEVRLPPSPPPLLRAALDGGLRRWRWLLLATLVGAAVGVPAALSMPLWFRAGVRMIPEPSRALPSKMPGFEPIDGATPEDVSGPGGAESAIELGRLLSILHSRTLTDDTIQHFDLMRVYGAKHIEDLREQFWNRLAAANLVPKEGYVDLQVEDQSPERAAAVANYMAGQANLIMGKLSSAAAAQERSFLEHRLGAARAAMEQAAQAFRDFQEQHKLVDLTVQADGVMSMLLRLKEQLVNQELELNRLKAYASYKEPTLQQAQRQVDSLRGHISQLEGQRGAPSMDYFTQLETVPELRQESERLQRDLKLKNGVYELLLHQYEMAKLAEVRDTRSFEVLDAAVVPTKKSRPSRAVVVATAALAGLLLAFGACALIELWPRLKALR